MIIQYMTTVAFELLGERKNVQSGAQMSMDDVLQPAPEMGTVAHNHRALKVRLKFFLVPVVSISQWSHCWKKLVF